MPGLFDLAFLIVISVGVPTYELYVWWPRVRAAVLAGDRRARVRWCRTMVAVQWGIAAIVVVSWLAMHRAWTDLGIAPITPWGVRASLALCTAACLLFGMQARRVARLDPQRRATLEPRMGPSLFIFPRTPEEYRWFNGLSLTAGICEELFYRGFCVWALTPWLGLWGGAGLSALLFGLGHIYQGREGVVRATLIGAALGLLALLVHSIVPGMVLHAIIDLGAFATAYALLRTESTPAVGS
jgi:membrane protease YdiL (CAAX protease family)